MSSQLGRPESPSFLDSPPPGSPEDIELEPTQWLPEQPDLLDSPPPGRPDGIPLEPTQRLPEQPDFETFAQHQRNNENSNDSTVTIEYDAEGSSNNEASSSNRTPIWNPAQLYDNALSYQENFSHNNPLRLERYVLYEDSNPIPIDNESLPLPVVQTYSNASTVTRWPINESSSGTTNRTEQSAVSLPEFQIRNEVCEEPPAKVRKISSSRSPKKSEEDDQDGETCPICLELWGNSGEHRLVALKCGHLFGLKCVERWLRAQAAKERSCPTCKSRATVRDIRYIYARRLVAADTAELTSLQKQVNVLLAERSKVEVELLKSKLAHRACLQQIDVMRNSIASTSQSAGKAPKNSVRFSLEKNLEVCKDGGCRVMAYNCRRYELYVSQKSSNNLFPGFGVRRVSCVDYKLGQFLHLHPKPIRDIAYSQPKDLLLSVSLDGSLKLVDRGIPSLSVQSGTPLWSCSWDVLRPQELFVGGVGGTILQYDIRNTRSPLHRLSAPGNTTPVVSLCSTEHGLLSCQLNSCWLWSPPGTSGRWKPRALPVEGPFLSMAYDSSSHRALVSCRPKGNERSKLHICNLTSTTSGATVCEVENTFFGSARTSLMSRATWVRASGSSWVAAHSESDSALLLHGLDGTRTMSLPATEPALDICWAPLMCVTILAALSESRLRMYKAVPINL